MKHFPVRPLAAAISLALCAGAAFAEPTYKLSGFGTLAAVHSDLDTADFTGSVFQPNGAGHTRATATTPDSKLGVQVNAAFNSQWSAVAQVISQYQYDGSYWPQLEWGNVSYKPVDALTLRAGRIALPALLMSESRLVGYAHPWARPPQEVYSILPLTSNDGIDASYRSQFGSVANSVQAYYGTNKVKISGGGQAKAKKSWGVNDTVEVGSLTLRAAYTYLKEDLQVDALTPAFAVLPFIPGGEEKYSTKDMSTHAIALGAQYDPGDWFVISEFVSYKGDGILSDNRSWYLAGGYRFGKFTPYLIHSDVKADIKEETGASGFFSFANGVINTVLYSVTPTQKTTAIGVRYDVYKNTAIKLQYDHLKTGSRSNGRLKTDPAWGFVQGSDANILTLGVDFVF